MQSGSSHHQFSSILPSIDAPNMDKSSPNRSKSFKSNQNQSLEKMEDNPFKLPSDDKIFHLREEERLRKQKQREENFKLKVWEKNNPDMLSRAQRIKELVGETKFITSTDINKNILEENMKITLPRRQEKENMTEFIAKKREMFLVQMSLDTKREEIRKLEEKAQMKEEALQRSEQMLEEDAMRFDAFLKENDKKAHEAMKRAEEETKKKQDKTQEIKRLNQQIQSLNSEMSKHKEALDDCLRYKQFLDQLTPPEWFEQYYQQIEQKKHQIKLENYNNKLKQWEKLRRKLYETYKRELDQKKEKQSSGGGNRLAQHRSTLISSPTASLSSGSVNHNDNDEFNEDENWEIKMNLPNPPKLEDEQVNIVIDDTDIPMYFKEPKQLMDIFTALEEQNLFLIQNSQETERSLEELQHLYRETKISMDNKTKQLTDQIVELKQQIDIEEKKVKILLSKRLSTTQSMNHLIDANNVTNSTVDSTIAILQTQQEKEKLLNSLNEKVRFVYEQCGFDASTKPNTLLMLSQLESKLEELLNDIDKLPVEYVIKAEKEKEKKRRERKREEQQAMQERKQEERNRNAIERSMKAPKKRTGRQVMFRSVPLRKGNKNIGKDVNDNQNDDEAKYLS